MNVLFWFQNPSLDITFHYTSSLKYLFRAWVSEDVYISLTCGLLITCHICTTWFSVYSLSIVSIQVYLLTFKQVHNCLLLIPRVQFLLCISKIKAKNIYWSTTWLILQGRCCQRRCWKPPAPTPQSQLPSTSIGLMALIICCVTLGK